jgi:hypothetical protein
MCCGTYIRKGRERKAGTNWILFFCFFKPTLRPSAFQLLLLNSQKSKLSRPVSGYFSFIFPNLLLLYVVLQLITSVTIIVHAWLKYNLLEKTNIIECIEKLFEVYIIWLFLWTHVDFYVLCTRVSQKVKGLFKNSIFIVNIQERNKYRFSV